jgi:hypothetical protein
MMSPVENDDNQGARMDIAERLRSAFIVRSLLPGLPKTDERDLKISSNSEEDESLSIHKRRQGVPLLGRRWIPTKRRGPLFG